MENVNLADLMKNENDKIMNASALHFGSSGLQNSVASGSRKSRSKKGGP
jgi:hypothetical protein